VNMPFLLSAVDGLKGPAAIRAIQALILGPCGILTREFSVLQAVLHVLAGYGRRASAFYGVIGLAAL